MNIFVRIKIADIDKIFLGRSELLGYKEMGVNGFVNSLNPG